MYGCLMEVIGYFCACVKATWIMYFVLIIPSRVWVCVVCLWLVVCVCVSLNGYMTNLASLMFVSTISEAFAWLQSYSPKFGPMRFAKTQWSTSAKVLTFSFFHIHRFSNFTLQIIHFFNLALLVLFQSRLASIRNRYLISIQIITQHFYLYWYFL